MCIFSFVPKSTYVLLSPLPTLVWATVILTWLLISVLSPSSHHFMGKSQIYSYYSGEQTMYNSLISLELVSFLWVARKTKMRLKAIWFSNSFYLVVYELASPILVCDQFGMGSSNKLESTIVFWELLQAQNQAHI